MNSEFSGKTAIVTGAGAGIGRSVSMLFAEKGANIVVADLLVEGGEETVSMIKENNGDAIFVKTDVTQSGDIQNLVDKTMETYGRLDYACNNAGISSPPLSVVEHPEDLWDMILNINLKGVWLCMKYEIPEMLKNGGGAIVNMGSIMSIAADANCPAYAASKHGVIGLTRSAALGYVKDGIRVNAVCPSFANTNMAKEMEETAPEIIQMFKSATPAERLVEPEEIAKAVVWLCSDEASFVNGHPMAVDGGFAAR